MSDDRVLAALAQLVEGHTRVEDRLTRLEDRLTKLGDGQTKLEDRLTKLEDGQTKLRVDVMARFERVEDNLSEIRDDINVNMHRADRADDNASHARDELRSMWRAIQKLRTRVEGLEDKGEA